jgi:carbonic anhydrase
MRQRFLVAPFLFLLAACASIQPIPSFPGAIPPDLANDPNWKNLMAGNEPYVHGSISYDGLVIDREKTAPHQEPPVTILSCADSRVPPELAFHQTVGDLFVVREAGNVADQFAIASIEYAIAKKYTKLIVILGHEVCGAVKAAIDNKGGTTALDALVKTIRLGFPQGHCTNSDDPKCVHDMVVANTRFSARWLMFRSKTIYQAVMIDKTVKLATAYYDLVSGRVELLPYPLTD